MTNTTVIDIAINIIKKVCVFLHKHDALVGQAGFEPTAPTTPRWCATKLRYCPLDDKNYFIIN